MVRATLAESGESMRFPPSSAAARAKRPTPNALLCPTSSSASGESAIGVGSVEGGSDPRRSHPARARTVRRRAMGLMRLVDMAGG